MAVDGIFLEEQSLTCSFDDDRSGDEDVVVVGTSKRELSIDSVLRRLYGRSDNDDLGRLKIKKK